MYSCRVKGHPMPKVTWEKDGIAIKENSHFKTTIHGDEYILELLHTAKTDSGSYTCRLSNPSGEASHTTTLVVKEKTDFRSILKTRSNLGKLGKQTSTDSEKSDKENESDFRNVLRRGERMTPPGGHDEKRTRGGVKQLDFRNVLKAKPEKSDSVIGVKSEPAENVRETVTLKSRETVVHKRETSSPGVKIEQKVPMNKALQEPQTVHRTVVEEDFMKSSKVPSKKIPEENTLKNRLNRFEQGPKIDQTPPSTFKSFSTPRSIQGKLNKFENRGSPNDSKPKMQSGASLPRTDQSVFGKLNKFENRGSPEDSKPKMQSGSSVPRTDQSVLGKLNKFENRGSPEDPKPKVQSGASVPRTDQSVLGKLNKFENLSETSASSKNSTPEAVPTSKLRGTALDKFSVTEVSAPNVQNGKSEFLRTDIKSNSSDKSLKSRMEKFEKQSETVEKSAKSKPDQLSEPMDSPWRHNVDPENVLTDRRTDIIQPPEIKRPLYDQRVRYGHQTVLQCEVTSGDINWSVNGKDIRGSKFFKMSLSDENIAKLTIAETYSEDEGEYMCTATNKYGSVSSSCKLSVDGASSSLSSRSDIEGAVTTPARLLSVSPTSVAVTGGQSVVIEAVFSGDPKPEVRWFKGRDEVQKDGRTSMETTSDRSILTINSITPDDAGKYIVAIENHAAKDSLCVSVSVEDVPEPPGIPQANDVMRSSIILWWCGSPYDGGSQITHYKVEMKKYRGSDWTTLTSNCKNTFYQVDGLEERTAYYFRVYAANKHGYSEPGEMSNKIFTSNMKISLDYESDDELPFEPRTVEVDSSRKFEDLYEVLHEVGKGKFGNVYQCKDKSSGQIWAAKILKCREKDKSNIHHEIEIMNELAHPKLMMIWDAFAAPRSMTLVMEFVGGGELFERVISDDFELTEGDCVHFMRQICDGVGYMHNKGILHLDLKPENILCISNHTNQIKIIDFGLARRFKEGKSIKVLFGTPEFIAPEVINYDEISFATDMWSLGVICYLLLSGLSPFLGDSDAETLANVTRGDYDFDDESFDDITDNAKDFIRCVLIKIKEKRHLIKPAQQHVWLAQDERRIRNKRLNTDRLKKFMARRKWQVYDDMDDIDSQDTSSGPGEDSQQRETTLGSRNGVKSPDSKKTCSDHNGNIAMRDQTETNRGQSSPPKFLKEMLDCEAFTGDVIRFDSRVAGSPEPEFHWLHEDTEVQEDSRHIIEVSDNGQCSLIIRNVGEQDDGEYSCVAVNTHGEVSCSAELIVCSIGAV